MVTLMAVLVSAVVLGAVAGWIGDWLSNLQLVFHVKRVVYSWGMGEDDLVVVAELVDGRYVAVTHGLQNGKVLYRGKRVDREVMVKDLRKMQVLPKKAMLLLACCHCGVRGSFKLGEVTVAPVLSTAGEIYTNDIEHIGKQKVVMAWRK